MTDRVTDGGSRPSLQKSGGAAPAASSPRPRTVLGAAVALVLAGVFAVLAAASLFGLHHYLLTSAREHNPVPPLTTPVIDSTATSFSSFLTSDLTAHPQLGATNVDARATDAQNWVSNHLPKAHASTSDISSQAGKMHDAVSSALGGVTGSTLTSQQISNQASDLTSTFRSNLTDLMNGQGKHLSPSELLSQANSTPKQALIPNVVLLIVLGLVAAAVLRGKYWSRWAVLGVWILATIGGSFAGITGILSVGSSVPGAFKVPFVLSSLSMIIAVLLANIRASTTWFDGHRPAGAPQRRGGLFAPRPPMRADDAAASRPAQTRSVKTRPADVPASRAGDRSKAKQRVSSDAVAKGADLARTRAKAASKSRRTGA